MVEWNSFEKVKNIAKIKEKIIYMRFVIRKWKQGRGLYTKNYLQIYNLNHVNTKI